MRETSFLGRRVSDKYEEPMCFSVPATDALFQPEQRSRTVELLTEGGKPFNMQIFSQVGHGFAVSPSHDKHVPSDVQVLTAMHSPEDSLKIHTSDGQRSRASGVLLSGSISGSPRVKVNCNVSILLLE